MYDLANKLYWMAAENNPYDAMDYHYFSECEIDELEKSLYWLKAAAENPKNPDHFRFLFECLKTITGVE